MSRATDRDTSKPILRKFQHGWGLGLVGLGLLLVGAWMNTAPVGLVAMTTGTALLFAALAQYAFRVMADRSAARELKLIQNIMNPLSGACLVVAPGSGEVLWANPAAEKVFEDTDEARLEDHFSGLTADPAALVQRLQDHAVATGRATHLVTLGAESWHYVLQRLAGDRVLWHIERRTKTDSRDTVPLAFAQFTVEGDCSYASPTLLTALGQPPATPATLCAEQLPEPDSITPLSPSLAPLGQALLRLHDAQERTDTFLIVPTAMYSQRTASDAGPAAADLDNLPIAMAHLNTDGKITYLNNEARRLLQWRARDAPLVSDILEGLGRPVMEWLNDIAKGSPQRATEVLRATRNDGETYLKVTLVRQQDDPSPDAEIIAVLSDVTELKSLEAKFTQSQKMQAIGQLAGGVAHDFNNLLTAISGHCDLLLLRHDRSDLDYPDLMQIQQNTNRAAALVRQLLALSRQQTLKFVTLDLQETMDDVIHLLNRLVGEKVTLTLHHGENVAPIRSDKRQFEQVLMNLVVNARDALPMGGEIRIETETVTVPQGFKHDHVPLPAGAYTIIRIRDDGTGIPQSLLSKIFDPFFTTKRPGEGTGLGLSTVYGIVKQSGGYIFAESAEGSGTTFTLYFTAQKTAPDRSPKPRRNVQGAPALRSHRALVLLVEDEAPVRSFAARALELQGHRVIEADCGETALDILANPDIKPDFFVTDVIMPGIDGPGWVARVRDRFPDTPVLFMSGYAEDSRVAAQARISNAAFLGKPFSLSEFTTMVNDRLEQATAA